ncbi:MFS transporter [Gryllotalpicola protaetiae]|uniref:MFS transporter n=1 Tax=Gryllotalpicola protaetiae TaxID=2419771 RepID=A0A387BSE6_9MICO|nr:MFS transporter [Gryllotalpicola protaetiae]AYG03936.1 MFS transporter [Gryllotalpicola protaetiae]
MTTPMSMDGGAESGGSSNEMTGTIAVVIGAPCSGIGQAAAMKRPVARRAGLPWVQLLALFTAGLIGMLIETLPAGILPQFSADMGVTPSLAGQILTVYALGSALAAIPINQLLAKWKRRDVVIAALGTFAIANAVTAASANFDVTLVARFVAGVGAALVYANVGGIAARISPAGAQARAVTIALGGAPVALTIGVPIGTFVATRLDWRWNFWGVVVMSVGLIVWMLATVPNLDPAAAPGEKPSVRRTLAHPGVVIVLLVLAGWVIVHNELYTYIANYLIGFHYGQALTGVLFTFGVGSLVALLAVGALIDLHHRKLVVAAMVLFTVTAIGLAVGFESLAVVYISSALWGLAFGGSTSLFITAATRSADKDGDTAMALVVTVFNLGIAVGGIVGGLALAGAGSEGLAITGVILMIPTVIATLFARKYAFVPDRKPAPA